MGLRTDLAVEKAEIKNAEKLSEKEIKKGEIILNEITRENEIYMTISFPELMKLNDNQALENEIITALNKLLPNSRDSILAVGLGNTEITADSIGPLTASRLLATRHIMGEFAENIGLDGLKSVSVISPNVLGKTGIEAAEIIKSVADRIKPQAVIAIDALCANSEERLFRTVQLTNTGITPGSGVKNSRKELSENTLGVPVIAIGVPTVMDIGIFKENDKSLNDTQMIVTPKDADILNEKICEILSRALNIFLQPEIEKETVLSLV